MAFPQRLKEIRSDLGLSQKEMAERLGVGFRTYQRYEDGTKAPAGHFLMFLVELAMTGYNLHWVITGDGDKSRFGTPATNPMLREIWQWLESASKMDKGYEAWFRIEFPKRFPEFLEYKNKE